MTTDNIGRLNELRRLFNNLNIERDNKRLINNSNSSSLLHTQKRSFKQNQHGSAYLLGNMAKNNDPVNLSEEDRELLKQIKNIKPLLEEFLSKFPSAVSSVSSKHISTPARTISEVLETMLLKSNNCEEGQKRKKNTLVKLLQIAGLDLNDEYLSFHNVDIINTITKYIVNQNGIKGDQKRCQLRYVKELAVCGSNIDPDIYKLSVINNLPNIEKTKKNEKKPHLPYSQAQLLEIFNPKYKHFKKHPDAFFICLIAMFTGARANSAITLQYDDIFEEKGIPCIRFIENHPIKHLKNEASERIVPIHSQLLKLGFVDYVRKRQRELEAKGTEFIFPKCQSKNGKYNNKYTTRFILSFLQKIGVKSRNNDHYDFHSFRKNASIAMQNAGISISYINSIIGWKGKSTIEQSYSNFTLEQIKTEMEKFNYSFLLGRFVRWRRIMKKMTK